ncbi:CD81 molecule b [Rhinichthys klamathensis goyatoka]|uniref:CD81 molecule b n=1 Tax=Rhinichthys klamathensis goyatoka TaxID=3034132 RepID=UPI0024B5AAE9|nr:CD81 molecule b [Rhinichthys klamathensis goyatoka]
MAVTGCSQCIKYMLFFLNFIFWLAGGVILGVALWLRHDSQTSNLLMLQFEGNQAPGTFYISVYVLIAIGAVMMFVGFLGCYGAIQESQCLLGTFFTCLVILFACEVAAGIWGFINRDTISTELINFYDTAYIKAVDPVETTSKQAAAKVLEVFHDTLECCGKGDDNELFTAVQASLCPKKTNPVDLLISQSCHTKLRDLFSEKLHVIGLAALVIAVIMVFEMIFTMVLCCAIRNAPAY